MKRWSRGTSGSSCKVSPGFKRSLAVRVSRESVTSVLKRLQSRPFKGVIIGVKRTDVSAAVSVLVSRMVLYNRSLIM